MKTPAGNLLDEPVSASDYFISGNFLNNWLRQSVRCKPSEFSIYLILKFIVVLYCMIIMYYPFHRVALPFIHEFGHYFMARATGVTPISFVVGNIKNPRITFQYAGTDFYIGPDSGGSQVFIKKTDRSCAIAAGGVMATLLLSISIAMWIRSHRGEPISIVYILMWAFMVDALASTAVNLFSTYPGADGVFLRGCF